MTRSRGVADYGYYPPVNSNILINPSFTVNQRGDVIDHNTQTYGPDRWKFRGINNVGGTMNQTTTVVDPTTGINKLLVKHRNATSNAYTRQNIEAVNLLGLYGKEMTLSFGYSDTGGSGVPNIQISSFDSSAAIKLLYDAVPTSLGNNRWTCTFILSTEDGTIPDPSESGLSVFVFANEANTAPAEWYLWETKLEVGSVATPFIARQYGEELALCQRYFVMLASRVTDNTNGSLIGGCVKYGSSTMIFGSYPVEMRSIPSLNQSGTISLRMASNAVSIATLVLDADSTTLQFRVDSSESVSTASDGFAGWARLSGDNSFVSFEAEL